MLDIKFIRQNPGKVKEGLQKKGVDVALVDKLLEADGKRLETLRAIEDMQAKKNTASKAITLAKNEKDKQKIIFAMQELDKNNDRLDEKMKELDKKLGHLMVLIPNLPLGDVPVGRDEKDNVVLRETGEKPQFSALGGQPKNYLEIAEKLDWIDVGRAAKVAGSRFGYLKNTAALLEFALVQFALNVLVKEGFIPVVPPVMIRPEVLRGMGRLAAGQEEERYYLSKDDLYLVGSAEHTLGPLHKDEIFEEEDLPRRYVAFSTCFRREAGSYGKDTKGILRVHQFDKVEMFSFVKPENSEKEHQFLLLMQEKLMQALALPYRVVEICTGDMGWTDARQYDIETWLPSEEKYRETHSCSNTTDFQAQGVNVRYRDKKTGQSQFVHMLNATAFAIGRTIIAIIENYQQKDGSVKMPEALEKYLV